MLSDRIVQLVESRAGRLETEWAETLRSHPVTPSFHKIDHFQLENQIQEVYQHLGSYLDRSSYDDEGVAHFFTMIGMDLQEQDIPMHEVIYALILARRILWDYINEESQFTTTLEWYQVSEFWQRVMHFFDKNLYFVVYGYEHAEDTERTKKDRVSQVLHAFSMGILPELDKNRLQ